MLGVCPEDDRVCLCDVKSLLTVTIWDLSKPDMGYSLFSFIFCLPIRPEGDNVFWFISQEAMEL